MLYFYACDCGATASKVLPHTRATYRPKCPNCRARMERDFAAEYGRPQGLRSGCAAWPHVADFACEVDAEDAKRAAAADSAAGVPTDYAKTDEGGAAPVWRSPKHRRDWLIANGMYDRNAGYSDPVPHGSVTNRRRF